MKDNLPIKMDSLVNMEISLFQKLSLYALNELEQTYKALKDNNDFNAEFHRDLAEFVGRPSPLYFAKGLLSITTLVQFG